MKSNKDNLLKNTNSNNNSFRKSFESKDKEKGKIIKADSKTRLVYDDDSNFPNPQSPIPNPQKTFFIN